MKLKKIMKPRPAVYTRLRVDGDLNVLLDHYRAFYAHEHGESIERNQMLCRMLRDYLEDDREFLKWLREQEAAES